MSSINRTPARQRVMTRIRASLDNENLRIIGIRKRNALPDFTASDTDSAEPVTSYDVRVLRELSINGVIVIGRAGGIVRLSPAGLALLRKWETSAKPAAESVR